MDMFSEMTTTRTASVELNTSQPDIILDIVIHLILVVTYSLLTICYTAV